MLTIEISADRNGFDFGSDDFHGFVEANEVSAIPANQCMPLGKETGLALPIISTGANES